MLMINADDFGLNQHCSQAIAQAFSMGLVTDTTMMATGDFYDGALKLAKEQGFFDRIGIHLNLTEGRPLTGRIKRCERFVTNGRFNKRYDYGCPLTGKEAEAIEGELTAQLEKMQSDGIVITHADSHHHIHTADYVVPIVLKVCREHGVNKLRIPRNLGKYGEKQHEKAQRYRSLLKKEGFACTRYFAYVTDVVGIHLPEDTEILVHPDFDKDGILIDRCGMEDGCPIGYRLPDLHTGQINVHVRLPSAMPDAE